MATFANMLKDEVIRLARKELRPVQRDTKKALAQARRERAALKRQVAALSRQLSKVVRRGPVAAEKAEASEGRRLRFTAKGLKTQRKRLGVSAEEYAKLAGVSAQSIYKWERGLARPRQKQIETLASLRGIGKKEAAARLQAK